MSKKPQTPPQLTFKQFQATRTKEFAKDFSERAGIPLDSFEGKQIYTYVGRLYIDIPKTGYYHLTIPYAEYRGKALKVFERKLYNFAKAEGAIPKPTILVEKRDIPLDVWDFVQRYYPNYHGCDEIAHNDDLHKLSEGEYEKGDCAHQLLKREYGGNLKNPRIKRDLTESNEAIYANAIEGYILEQRAEATVPDFFDTYQPRVNHILRADKKNKGTASEHLCSFNGCMYETYGKELKYISGINGNPIKRKHLWTIMEADGKQYVVAGVKLVNRLGYLITDKSWVSGNEEFKL